MKRSSILVTQTLAEFQRASRNTPFKEYLHKLRGKDRLPRGEFFKGKKALGPQFFFVDEYWPLTPSLQNLMRLDLSQPPVAFRLPAAIEGNSE